LKVRLESWIMTSAVNYMSDRHVVMPQILWTNGTKRSYGVLFYPSREIPVLSQT